MKDVDINKYFGIPISTIQDWKKSDPTGGDTNYTNTLKSKS